MLGATIIITLIITVITVIITNHHRPLQTSKRDLFRYVSRSIDRCVCDAIKKTLL